jgi:hypothetical protein
MGIVIVFHHFLSDGLSMHKKEGCVSELNYPAFLLNPDPDPQNH